jgi:hypothetical protein
VAAVVKDPLLSVVEQRRLDPQAFPSSRLILTADHPVYSARTRGLVSHNPDATSSKYKLNAVERFDEARELLRGARGEIVQAESRPSSEVLSSVFTLKLDKHHWFYANGVLVHNKGGGDYGEHERAYYLTPGEWAAYVVKRRKDAADAGQGEPCKKTPDYNTTGCRWMTAHVPSTTGSIYDDPYLNTKSGEYVEATGGNSDTFTSTCTSANSGAGCSTLWAGSAGQLEQAQCPATCDASSTNTFCRCDHTDDATTITAASLTNGAAASVTAADLHPQSCFCDMSCLCETVATLCTACLACEDAACVQDGTTFGSETHVDDTGATITSVSFCEGYIDQTFTECDPEPTAAPASAAWPLTFLLAFWRA